MDKITKEDYLKACEIIISYQSQIKEEYILMMKFKNFTVTRKTKIENIDGISVRLMNILKSSEINNIDDLLRMNIISADGYRKRGFGNKTRTELKDIIDNLVIIENNG